MLDDAIERTSNDGRVDVAEYLRLKASNDSVRRDASDWLIETAKLLSEAAKQRFPLIRTEITDPFRFPRGNATMAGKEIAIYNGVRCLRVAVGWTRTPADGFMRGGAMAAARILHFGMPKLTSLLVLIKNNDLYEWRIEESADTIDAMWLAANLRQLLD